MMTVVKTREEYWAVPLDKRKYYCLGEDLLVSYPSKDNGEAFVSVAELFKKANMLIRHKPPKQIAKKQIPLLLRKTPAHMLLQGAKQLPSGLAFQVSEGYRPLWFQREAFEEIFADMKKQYPKWSEKEVWNETTLYVADPNGTPPHSTGGTLDLTIVDQKGKPIDMGNPMNTVGSDSNTFAEGLTKKQEENRMLLFSTMTKVGFVNLASEWWHYSYGDQYWAIYYQKPHAIYDRVEKVTL